LPIKSEEIKADGRLQSVAIIMDGNGRWAKRRLLPRNAGHAEGVKNIERVLRVFREIGVHHVTLYAFSTENWKRPKDEVDGLMELAYKYLTERLIPKLCDPDYEMSIKFIGDKSRLSARLRDKCIEAERLSAGRPFVCNVAFNYGARDEIVRAANAAIADGYTTLSEDLISRYLYTSHSPDPDLIIRTGGEFRLSNFLLWQAAYSEFYVTDTLWPDFDREDIARAVEAFYSRDRRYGGLNPEERGGASEDGLKK